MLHGILKKLSSSQNVCVNVTWHSLENVISSNSQNVYVNVTWHSLENVISSSEQKMFV
jgi:hypothetical protein